MGIWHWKLGDIALARICKKVYAKVRVIVDEKGLFYDDKVLGISAKEDGSLDVTEELCYYVEDIRTGQKLWVPWTSLHLAERSRPFYGVDRKISPSTKKTEEKANIVPKKRKLKEDHTLPLDVKPSRLKILDLNVTYDLRHVPLKQGKYENAFNEFVRRGKETLFDQFYTLLEKDKENNYDVLDYLLNVDASSEDKIEMVLKDKVTEKEIENYLHQCWRYNFVHKNEKNESLDDQKLKSPTKAEKITVHTTWCLVCAGEERLRECPNCPSSFHLACRKEWLTTIMHRKSPQRPDQPQKQTTLIKKILSSTRVITHTSGGSKETTELCPSCMWGPRIGYNDIVWHKLGHYPWWPARVLPPGSVPPCLLSANHHAHEYPLRYYGTGEHAWARMCHMTMFLPRHTETKTSPAAVLAATDYICTYLT